MEIGLVLISNATRLMRSQSELHCELKKNWKVTLGHSWKISCWEDFLFVYYSSFFWNPRALSQNWTLFQWRWLLRHLLSSGHWVLAPAQNSKFCMTRFSILQDPDTFESKHKNGSKLETLGPGCQCFQAPKANRMVMKSHELWPQTCLRPSAASIGAHRIVPMWNQTWVSFKWKKRWMGSPLSTTNCKSYHETADCVSRVWGSHPWAS